MTGAVQIKILKGVTEGSGPIFAAEVLVIKEVSSYSIDGANPAKVIKMGITPEENILLKTYLYVEE